MSNRTPLCLLAQKHGTDKAFFHEYARAYHAWLHGKTVRLLVEIGIGGNKPGQVPYAATVLGYDYQPGASLRMWRDYFPKAAICGIDVDRDNLVFAERIQSYLADQGDPDSLRAVVEDFVRRPDVIIDDGSHRFNHQVTTAHALLPLLAPQGLYFIEDMNCDPQRIIDTLPDGYASTIINCPSPYPVTGQLLVIQHDTAEQ